LRVRGVVELLKLRIDQEVAPPYKGSFVDREPSKPDIAKNVPFLRNQRGDVQQLLTEPWRGENVAPRGGGGQAKPVKKVMTGEYF
jgi:hypothetical protein